jgi:hypothetical protein
MAKRIKKATIKPEQRRDWLKRSEELGESPPQIASKDGYDIRTVRKQIEQAKQEREQREARSMVLRTALEQHYEDLRRYAEKLNSRISGQEIATDPDEEFFSEALRQHLPRSPIYSYLAKLQDMKNKDIELQLEIENLAEIELKKDSRVKAMEVEVLENPVSGMVKALGFLAKQGVSSCSGLDLKANITSETAGTGFIILGYGAFPIIKVRRNETKRLKEVLYSVLEYMEKLIRNWEPYHELDKSNSDSERIKQKLREELAIIRLRRLVPGRCKYCPL